MGTRKLFILFCVICSLDVYGNVALKNLYKLEMTLSSNGLGTRYPNPFSLIWINLFQNPGQYTSTRI